MQKHCGKTELGMLNEQNKGLSVQGRLVKDDELERDGFGFYSVKREAIEQVPAMKQPFSTYLLKEQVNE